MANFEVFMTENITSLFTAIVSWFFQIFDATNTVGIFVTAVGIYLSFRFLIKPLVGVGFGSSDQAKKKSDKSDG